MTDRDTELLLGHADEIHYLVGWLAIELAKERGISVPELVASIPPLVKPAPRETSEEE